MARVGPTRFKINAFLDYRVVVFTSFIFFMENYCYYLEDHQLIFANLVLEIIFVCQLGPLLFFFVALFSVRW